MYATKLFSQSSEPSQAADGDNDGKDDVPEYVYKALTFEEISDLLQNSNEVELERGVLQSMKC